MTQTTIVEVNPETGKACRLLTVPTLCRKVNSDAVPHAQGRAVTRYKLTGRESGFSWKEGIELFGLIFPLAQLVYVEECLDVVSNGVGTSVVIFLSDKTVKIFTSAETIDAFFKVYQ